MATRRGDLAKELITRTLLDTFPGAFIVDKKIYVPAQDGGNGEVQIAVSLTMPKNPIEAGNNSNVSAAGGSVAPAATPTELSTEDKEKVAGLMAKLGLS